MPCRVSDPSGKHILSGRAVLITRPAAQAGQLAHLVAQAGGEPVLFPAIEIEPLAPSPQAAALLARLDTCDLAVFVSANAVTHGLPLIRSAGGWPARLRAVAVGAATAAALRAQGIDQVLAPERGADSEALLALPEMQAVRGLRVVVFRGVGGRELLAETLRSRGAEVDYIECYRRRKPRTDPGALRRRLQDGALLHAVTAASAEALANLVELAGPQAPRLLALPLFVPHGNIAEAAARLGFRLIRVTDPGDEGLLRGMLSYFASSA
jgi:uroporphyrinogen-III synthase